MADRECTIPGCGKPERAKGWCAQHYTRWKRHGDPLFVIGAGVLRTTRPTYFTKHARVKKTRGSARQHLCAVGCGDQAHDWATIHGRDGLDVFLDYMPLCARCHQEYDGQHANRARGSANGNAKLTDGQVAEIKAALRSGRTIASIARAFGRAHPTIDNIRTGRTWRHVS